MKYSQITLTTLVAMFLVACGGGSNNDMAKDSQNQNPPPSKEPSTPDRSIPPPNTKLVKITGNYIKVDAKDNHKTSRYRIFIPKGNIDWFFTNGEGHYLRPTSKSAETFTTLENKSNGKDQKIIASNHLSYASYGVVRDNLHKQSYVFAQGSPTVSDKVPSAEGAYYHGYALHSEINSNNTVTGNSVFAIDFRSKKLTGKITVGGKEIPLEANLKKDASFSGKNRLGTAVQGSLFGPNAEELAGTYLNTEENFNGAFGASQKKSNR